MFKFFSVAEIKWISIRLWKKYFATIGFSSIGNTYILKEIVCEKPVMSLFKEILTFFENKSFWRTSAPFDVYIPANSSSLSGAKFVGQSRRNFFLIGAAIRAKLISKRQNTLHKLNEDLRLVTLVSSWGPRMASVVWDAISRCIGRITCPK